MAREIYRKTAAGHAEVRQRGLGLDARTRGLLILANGELSTEQLAQRVGFDPAGAIAMLVAAGLLEVLPAPPRPRVAPVAAPVPPAATPVTPAPAAAAVSAATLLVPSDLPAARTRAVTVLAPHYGPDALRMAESLRSAVTPPEFGRALAELRATLAVHLGKRLAEQLATQIAHGP
ncbi:MAG: hypothetical protein KF788_01895 [Piscinibacter sp.]|nr:hypothetical protein [Piscinibacter sp.]